MTFSIVKSDVLDFFRAQPEGSIDLVFGSPPYEEARLYLEDGQDMGIARDTDEWVAWMVEVFGAAQRVCKGLVAFVVAGQTDAFKWSAGPALLAADLHRAGMNLRNPPIYRRNGIPGSGGPDWLASCYEWIICTSKPGRLLWSDNTACGAPPKYPPGGKMTHRTKDGKRVSKRKFKDPAVHQQEQGYVPPDIANPGNVIDCIVGGGRMGEGDAFARHGEAPFPEKLAEFFVLSFCPPGGLVCDPFSGSGTTAAVSVRHGRSFTGCDLRQSQVNLGLRRLQQETPLALFNGQEASE